MDFPAVLYPQPEASVNVVEQIQQSLPPQAKAGLDVMAFIGWISALAGTLTPIVGFFAAIASLGWCVIRLYETKTVQRWMGK